MELLFSNMTAQWVIIPLQSLIHTLCNSFWLFHILTYPHVQEVLPHTLKYQATMSKWGNRHEFLRDSKSVIGRSVVYLLIDFVCLSRFLTETAQVVVFIRSVSICGVWNNYKHSQTLKILHLNYFSMSVQALVYHPSLLADGAGKRCSECDGITGTPASSNDLTVVWVSAAA